MADEALAYTSPHGDVEKKHWRAEVARGVVTGVVKEFQCFTCLAGILTGRRSRVIKLSQYAPSSRLANLHQPKSPDT